MNKMLPLFAGVALLAGVSAANAGEPMLLTTAQMDNVTAGGNYDFTRNITVHDTKYITTYVDLEGNSAVADAKSEAYGYYTTAQALTHTYTEPGYSEANSTSVAASQYR